MQDIRQAEVTVTKVWPPKGKYFAFNCAELVTDQNKYGRVSAPASLYSKVKEKQIYKIAYHETEDGYLNLDTLITESPMPPKQNVRPATNPADSDRMAVMGMVNNFIACGQVAKDPDEIAKIIRVCHDGLMRSVIKGKQVQRRDDLNDEIPFP